MDKLFLGSRYILGLIFTVFGLNGFLQFIPMPPPTPEMGSFMGALAATGYFFPLLKGTEILVGLALLSGKFVPLSLVILAPITINILAVHVFIDMGGLAMGVFVTALHVIVMYAYKDAYAALLKP